MKLKPKYSRLSLGFLLILFLPLFSWAKADVATVFKQGNQFYAKAQFEQATQTYQQILKDGYTSAPLYFNLGNAYYKQDDMASAILYYEKAHKLAPNDADINNNIRFVNSKIADKIDPQPAFFLNRWWHSFILILPADTLALLSALLVLGGFLLLIVYLLTGSVIIKKITFYSGIAIIFLGLISIFLANRQVSYFDAHQQAIVFSNSVIVKGAPNDAAKPLFVMHQGTKINVLQTTGSWIEVGLPNGNSGWITAENVKDI